MVIVHFFMNHEMSFPEKAFKLSIFGFHVWKLGDKPASGCGDRNRTCFDWGKGIEDVLCCGCVI